jgi:hypothetical protein
MRGATALSKFEPFHTSDEQLMILSSRNDRNFSCVGVLTILELG